MKKAVSPQNRNQFPKPMYWTNVLNELIKGQRSAWKAYILRRIFFILTIPPQFFSVFKVTKPPIQTFSPKNYMSWKQYLGDTHKEGSL